ncbi:MAG: prolyl oligopeptidase family serine peptidase [Bacteroidota bacterium]
MKRHLLLLCLFSSSLIYAQYSIKDILSSPFPTSLVTAQQSEQVAWVFNEEGKRNIWIADLSSGQSQAITDYQLDDGQAIDNLQFTPDDQAIIFVRGGAPNRRGEIPNPTSKPEGAQRLILSITLSNQSVDTLSAGASPTLSPDGQLVAFLKGGQVWVYDWQAQKAKKAFTIRGSASGLRWSPDSRILAFESRRGDHAYIGLFSLEDQQLNYISPSVDNDSQVAWSPDSKSLAFIRVPSQSGILPFMPRRSALPWSIMIHDLTNNKTREIWKAQEGAGSAFRGISSTNAIFWTQDNHIVFPYEGEGYTQLYSVPVQGGPAKWLTPGQFEVQFVSITPDRKQILYSSNQDDVDRQHVWSVSPGQSPQLLSGSSGVQWSPIATQAGRLFCLASSETFPAYVAEIKNGKLEQLAKNQFPKSFPGSKALVEPEQIIFSASDGMQIHGQLFKPAKMEKGKKYPAVLFFHGGSRRQMLLGFHHRGYYHNAYALNQYLASQGYIVLSVNYRSGIGYGMEFREALNYGARGASEFNDVMGAGTYLRSRSDVDPNKIGLWGGSYGGYLTALGLAKASDLFAAGVDIHGVHDWNVVINNFVRSYDPAKQAEVAALALQSSPMPYVKDWRSPVLLIHGDDDRNVPFSETVTIVEALRQQKVHFEQLIFPDEVHGFLLHKNWVAAYEATADFFDRMLKK